MLYASVRLHNTLLKKGLNICIFKTRIQGLATSDCIGQNLLNVSLSALVAITMQMVRTFLEAMLMFAANTGSGQISLRLVGGLSPAQGRVQVRYQNVWGTVCDDSWDNRDATVVCKQLGYA